MADEVEVAGGVGALAYDRGRREGVGPVWARVVREPVWCVVTSAGLVVGFCMAGLPLLSWPQLMWSQVKVGLVQPEVWLDVRVYIAPLGLVLLLAADLVRRWPGVHVVGEVVAVGLLAGHLGIILVNLAPWEYEYPGEYAELYFWWQVITSIPFALMVLFKGAYLLGFVASTMAIRESLRAADRRARRARGNFV